MLWSDRQILSSTGKSIFYKQLSSLSLSASALGQLQGLAQSPFEQGLCYQHTCQYKQAGARSIRSLLPASCFLSCR